jgi:Mg-chelatase subunit ChlD
MTDLADYRLLAAAVTGRPIVIGPTTESEPRAWSDGAAIHLPGHSDETRDGLVVQAALLAVGSLTPALVARTTGRRSLRLRYLTLEAVRAMHLLDDVVPRRVARRVASVYSPARIPASAAESLKRASGRERIPEAPEWMGTIKPSRVMLNLAGRGAGPSSEDQQSGPPPDRFEELDDDDESDRSKILELFATPLTRNALAEALQRFLGAGRSPAEDSAGGDELSVAGSRVGVVGENAKAVAARVDLDFGRLAAPVGRRYPEWDCHHDRYRPDRCSVYEYDPPRPSGPLDLDAGCDAGLLRELARLGLAHERHRRQADGETLDVTALIEHVVDRATGSPSDERVYELRRRTAHDLGVVVLLDVSSSTRDAEDGARVFDEQRRIVARLISVLDRLGDRVAGYAFQSFGAANVRFLRIKDFDDRFDLGAQRRLATLEPGGFTRLGAAVRHGTHLLADRSGTRNTLLIVVGDGLPYDDGYEHRYAQEDSRRAISEAVERGIGCACLSVRTATDDAVIERVWGHVPHIKLERVGDLSRGVLPVFRRALHEAVLLGRDGRSQPAAVCAGA